jgi:hypothetical protein
MTTFSASLRSTFRIAATRYARSKGLWILLIAGLLGARFWVPRDDHISVIIAVNSQLPVITSAMIGLSLATVLTTLLPPFGYIYLRTNINRRQPWQITEVTSASTISIAFGAFLADAAVFTALLAVMTLAGWVLAFLALPFAEVHLWQIAVPLWLSAAPALLGLAAIYRLFESLTFTRRAFGDVLFFALWCATIIFPIAGAGRNTFAAHMHDPGGSIQVLAVMAGTLQYLEISIGSATKISGHILLQPIPVILQTPYLAARLAWSIIALAIVILAGLLHRPHTARRKRQTTSRWLRWTELGPPPAAPHPVIAAPLAAHPLVGLFTAELRLIFRTRPARLACLLVAVASPFLDYRHVISPALFLLLIFGITAEAAREETTGILHLTRTMLNPNLRRAALIAAGTASVLALSLPAILIHHTPHTLFLAITIGLGVSAFTVALTSITRSAFAARLLLLIAWYGYISA